MTSAQLDRRRNVTNRPLLIVDSFCAGKTQQQQRQTLLTKRQLQRLGPSIACDRHYVNTISRARASVYVCA